MPKKALLWAAIGWTCAVSLLCLVSFQKFPSVGVAGADKYVHVFFHFTFTVLWFLYLKSNAVNADAFRLLTKIVFWSVLFGIAIEIAQELFTDTRKADFLDIAANFSGSIIATIALLSYDKLLKK